MQVVPMGTPTWRQRKIEELGAHVVRHGETLTDAAAECGTLCALLRPRKREP